ncbi:MAG: hypothetical protein L6R41_006099 [Letrouitia leprolyta]|nr:MAG: hypothetical protein L6R41_006099 [Letrouitia leprolyta]
MAHRDRGVGREREREREVDDYRRREREPPREREREYVPSSRGAPLNEFFVDGEGIHREVMQREICKYLGQDALSRPGTYNGKKGFFVTALRPFTSKMVEDLQILSQKYERERREASSRGYRGSPVQASSPAASPNQSLDLPYSASKAAANHEAADPYEGERYIPQGRHSEMYPEMHPEQYSDRYIVRDPDSAYPPGYGLQSGYPPGPNYASSQAPGYPPVSGYPPASSYPAGSAYPQSGNYPATSGYPPSSGFAAPGYASTSGIPGARGEPNYIYTNQPDEYSSSGYPYQQSSMYPGAPPTNPRTGAGYPYVTAPPDSTLRGVPMDDQGYSPYGQQMSIQPGRSGYPAPSRGTPTHFDPPQPRDGFTRADTSRDDRRRR